jgi:hypothetical protein
MTLKEYTENLVKLMKEKPETADLMVVTSRDDEGNGFNLVYYEPSVGIYDKEDRGFETDRTPANAVCVN